MCAVWGAPSQRVEPEDGQIDLDSDEEEIVYDHRKPLLLTGDPEAYVAELEDLVLALVFGTKADM